MTLEPTTASGLPEDFNDLDLCGAALALASIGLHVFPARQKVPYDPATRRELSFTTRATTDTQTIVSWFAGATEGELQVAVACGPSGLVVVDEDHLDVLPIEWHDTTLCSVTREDRMQWWYRVPEGRRLGNSTGTLPDGFGEIRAGNAYVIAPPSMHHETGRRYQFFDAATPIVTLPNTIGQHLPEAHTSERAATSAEVQAFVDAHTESNRPNLLGGVMSKAEKLTADGKSVHETAVVAVPWALREARAGCYPAQTAIDTLEGWFLGALANRADPRPPGRGEWQRIVSSAVAWAEADDLDEIIRRLPPERDTIDVLEGPRPTNDHEALLLPRDVWDERPVLAHIRAAALARMTPPDAVLHAVLARVAALTSHTVELPPNVGGSVGLSYMTMLVGRAGNGKSTSIATARDLVPAPANHSIADGLPIGSGEGLAEVLFDTVTEPDPNTGKPTKVRRQVRHNALVSVDEGTLLAELGQRKGTTVLSTLRTIYTHGTIGNTNASLERRRIVHGHSYVYGLIVGIQPDLAGPLLDPAEVAAGTPQRFSWVWCVDPSLTPDLLPWPGALQWEPHGPGDLNQLERVVAHGAALRHRLPVPAEVTAEIRREIHRGRTTEDTDDLDAHIMLQRLKVAALLGILDGRLEVSTDDWRLAGVLVHTSRVVRDHVRAVLRSASAREEKARTDMVIRREAATEDAAYTRALASAVRSVAKKVQGEGRATKRVLRHAISGKHRQLGVTVEDAIARAVEDGLIRPEGDEWVPARRAA